MQNRYQVLVIGSHVTTIDSEDFDYLSQISWWRNDAGYAITKSVKPARLHRHIMERVLGRPLATVEQVDHVNGNRLDNRRCNLRLVSNQLNAYNRPKQTNNTTGFKGVVRTHKSMSWTFEVKAEGIRVRWGGWETKEEAAWMYDQFASQMQGEHTYLNFIYV